MYETPKISNAEWEVMKIIWNHPKITSIHIIQELKDKSEWKPTTVKSLINRLLNKNVIGFNKSGNEYLYFPLISEDECIRHNQKNNKSICQTIFHHAASAN